MVAAPGARSSRFDAVLLLVVNRVCPCFNCPAFLSLSAALEEATVGPTRTLTCAWDGCWKAPHVASCNRVLLQSFPLSFWGTHFTQHDSRHPAFQHVTGQFWLLACSAEAAQCLLRNKGELRKHCSEQWQAVSSTAARLTAKQRCHHRVKGDVPLLGSGSNTVVSSVSVTMPGPVFIFLGPSSYSRGDTTTGWRD